jgi:alkylation response protein AidB-like acyl-CoA dehydrogenase
MEFALDEPQALLRDSVARFVARHPFLERRHRAGAGHWTQFAQMGWLGAGLPEAMGGYGGAAIETAVIAQQLGRGLVQEPFVDVAVLAAQVLCACHGEPAAQSALGALIDGRRVVVPALQGQAALLRTTAGGARLSGLQALVADAPRADAYLVAATEAGATSLLLIDAATRGLHRHGYRLVDGSAACDLRFDDVAIAAIHRLGPPGSAGHTIEAARDHAAAARCAEALGVMELALSTTRDYLLQRRQFGVAIASFQALRHRLADMLIALEQARATLHGALAALSAGGGREARRRAVAVAKVRSSRSGRFIGAQAIQLHGGIGMTDEYIIGHCFKRLMVLDTMDGGAAAHMAALAAEVAIS